MKTMKEPSPCPICNSKSESAFVAKGYTFSRCSSSSCSHLYVDPMPTLEELDNYYSKNTAGVENSDSWTMVEDYERNPSLICKFYEKSRIRFLRRRAHLDFASSVLDVGCSTGMFLRVLKDLGFVNLMGVDVSKQQIAHCNEVNEIEAYRQIEDIPTNRIFDLVTLYKVLEHVPNPVEVLSQSAQRLSSHGRLVVDVPNYRSLYRVVSGKKWLWLIPPVHLQYFSPKSIEKLASEVGLEVDYASTKSTSTYIYIVTHHIFEALGKQLPTTSLSTSRIKTLFINLIEGILRFFFFPFSVVMQITKTHNQIIYVFKRK
jgi:2-polyprenyl-3-methyl-5-hydroxy-6-metoxy-1,4-benzoquinol methylase